MSGGQTNKASKLLGIVNESPSADDVAINIQHCGDLQIRENEKRSVYKKRYCVVKDAFFLWYETNTHQGFDRKPKGIFPLNGSWINHLKDVDDGRTIELIHPDIARANFLLRAESKAVAQDWFYCFDSSKKATWENAQLGVAMLEKMKAEGTKLEDQKADAVKQLEEKVARLNKENQDKLKILEREQRQEDKFKEKMEKEESKLKEREENLESVEKMNQEIEDVHKKAAEKRKSLEMKLKMANMALRRLETAFEEEFKNDTQAQKQGLGVEVEKSVMALRGFFENTIASHREKQRRLIAKNVERIQKTMGRGRGKKPEPDRKPSLY